MSRILNGPRTLRARFMLVALVGVLLPLAIVAIGLTNATERAGRRVLREQLSLSADEAAATVAQRWEERQGELLLLAANSAAGHAIAGRLTEEDSLYLQRVVSSLSSSFTDIRYIDAGGEERWSAFRDAGGGSADPFGTLRLTEPVSDPALGAVHARLRLSSLLPDSSKLLPAGGVATIRRQNDLLWSSASGVFDATTLDAKTWEIEQREVAGAGLTLAMASRVSPFVKPFEQATQTGLSILAVVVLVVVVYTTYLTSRLTRSLQALGAAALGISEGRLDVRVDPPDDDDIAPVARAFNRMSENLRATIAELSEQRALAAVGEFAASLSHEVRNSLTALRVDLQNARRQIRREDPVDPLLERTLESVQRLDASVTTALRMARGTAAVRERVSIRATLANAMDTARAIFTERGVGLDPPEGNDDAVILADASALEQVFVNVLVNAAEAMQPGGRAHVDLIPDDQRVSVRITDTGSGFSGDPSTAGSRLFETTKQRGTGLGLPIARRITETYGGRLLIENAFPGAVVIIELPTAPVAS